jgi:general stress protein 26
MYRGAHFHLNKEESMSNEELKKKIFNVIEQNPLASFATVKEGNPWVRYVVLNVKDGEIYFTAGKQSRKVAQLQANPHCHTIAGGDIKDFSKGWIQIDGTARILEDLDIKKALWHDYLSSMFTGPEDPNYIVIHIKPEFFEYWGDGKMEPQVYRP